MTMDQTNAMATLRKEGYEIPVMMLDGEPHEMLSIEAVLRLCDIAGTKQAARFKRAIRGNFNK